MILGIGTDLCDVSRMASAIERTGERFLARVFTPAERMAAEAAPRPACEFARFFAVKEATFKVLGRGWPDEIGFDEIELDPRASAPKRVLLHGRAARWAAQARIGALHAATSGDEAVALAVVVAEDR